jgi:hypothetical protein
LERAAEAVIVIDDGDDVSVTFADWIVGAHFCLEHFHTELSDARRLLVASRSS